jgi:hypothetical protein
MLIQGPAGVSDNDSGTEDDLEKYDPGELFAIEIPNLALITILPAEI